MAITFTAGTSVESTASVTSTTVTLPAGLAAGDYTIIVVSLNVSSGSITFPAGWTEILPTTASVNGSTADKLAIAYRKWVSGDTDPVITTASGRVAMTPIKVSGADGTTFVDTAATVSQMPSPTATVTAPSITPASDTLVCVLNGRDATNGAFQTPYTNLSASMTKIAEASGKAATQTNAGHCIAYEVVTAGAATGTRSADPAQPAEGSMGVSFSLNAASTGTTVTPTGVATAAGVGTPALSSTVTVTPTGIASAGVLGAPTVTAPATTSPSGIASGAAIGTPSATGQTTVSPSGVASAAAPGTPTLTGSTSVTPGGIAGASTTGTPTLSSSMVATPTGIPSAAATGTPTASSSTTASPTGIPSAAAVGSPTLSEPAGSTTVTPTGIPSAISVGTPALAAPTSVQPSGIASAAALGSPTLSTPGTVTVQPTGIASRFAAGTPTITPWTVLRPTGIPTKKFVGQPLLLTSTRVTPAGVASAAVVGLPTMGGPGAGEVRLDLETSISKSNLKASITERDRAAGLGTRRWKGHIG